MRFFRPEPETTDTDAERVGRIDRDAIEEFIAAYSAYVKRLGTQSIQAIALYHAAGETGELPFYTLHIQLAGPEQSLQVYLALHEDSLDIVDEFLEAEFDTLLDREDAEEVDCGILFQPDAVLYAETIPLLARLGLDSSRVEIRTVASPVAEQALSYYAFAASGLTDSDDPALSRKLWTYSLVAGEPSEEPPDEVFLVGVVEETLADGNAQRRTSRITMAAEDYEEFCVVLAWLCEIGGTTDFESLNHLHGSDEDLAQAIMALHKDELAQFDTLLQGLPELLNFLLSTRDEEDAPPPLRPARIVH